MSKKLSETLHYLDESLSENVTSLAHIERSEMVVIREQLLSLQEMLIALEISQPSPPMQGIEAVNVEVGINLK